MKEDTRRAVLARLRSVQGHLRGVEKMVEEDKYCVDVLQQTFAIEKALARIDEMVLEGHLETCVADSFRAATPRDHSVCLDRRATSQLGCP